MVNGNARARDLFLENEVFMLLSVPIMVLKIGESRVDLDSPLPESIRVLFCIGWGDLG